MSADVFVLPTPAPDEPAEGVAALGHYEAAERYVAAAEAGGPAALAHWLAAQTHYTAAIAASDLESKGLLT